MHNTTYSQPWATWAPHRKGTAINDSLSHAFCHVITPAVQVTCNRCHKCLPVLPVPQFHVSMLICHADPQTMELGTNGEGEGCFALHDILQTGGGGLCYKHIYSHDAAHIEGLYTTSTTCTG